jgi:hypothetical protein
MMGIRPPRTRSAQVESIGLDHSVRGTSVTTAKG